MDMTRMGAFLQALRKAQGLTQEQLGEKLHVSSKTISRWETGTYMPPVEMLLALSELYGVSMNELVAGERLTPQTLQKTADDNLTAALKDRAVFQLHERRAFWQKKWDRDHWFSRIFIVALLLAAYLLGLYLNEDLLTAGAVIGAVCASLYFTNRHAGYVEHHLFDDQG